MIPERRQSEFNGDEKRAPEGSRRVQRTVAGLTGGIFVGPFAVIFLLKELGYQPTDWRVLVLGLGINAAIAIGTICLWDIRWYLSHILQRKFGLPVRNGSIEKEGDE